MSCIYSVETTTRLITSSQNYSSFEQNIGPLAETVARKSIDSLGRLSATPVEKAEIERSSRNEGGVIVTSHPLETLAQS